MLELFKSSGKSVIEYIVVPEVVTVTYPYFK